MIQSKGGNFAATVIQVTWRKHTLQSRWSLHGLCSCTPAGFQREESVVPLQTAHVLSLECWQFSPFPHEAMENEPSKLKTINVLHLPDSRSKKQISESPTQGTECTSRGLLVVPRYRLGSYGQRAFSVAGLAIWHWLPDSLRDPAISISSFERSLKAFLFSAYSCT